MIVSWCKSVSNFVSEDFHHCFITVVVNVIVVKNNEAIFVMALS
jgi:hypothetical protein